MAASDSAMDSQVSSSCPQNPLIVIVGATGTGKSTLAISLAKHLAKRAADLIAKEDTHTSFKEEERLGAEIVNADAMQIYTGLPITTNKLSEAEQNGIPHHLLGAIPIDVKPWSIKKYVKEADKAIAEIKERDRMPIVVGGTGYYVHGLLLDGAGVDSSPDNQDYNRSDDGTDNRQQHPILSAPTKDILARLQEVDPVIAQRWHPNDRRRIQTSLEIYLNTGRKASDVYADQKNELRDGDATKDEDTVDAGGTERDVRAGTPRYNPLVFWLEAEDKILKDRLNKRVDSMLASGLLDEVQTMAAFEKDMSDQGVSVDQSEGIWVSIGYKEMKPWLEHVAAPDTEPDTRPSLALRQSCIEAVKAGTRRYAKRQNRYIRIRFARALAAAGVRDRLIMLDCSDLDQWQDTVVNPATKILDAFLQGKTLPKPEGLSELARKTFADMSRMSEEAIIRVARPCEPCGKVLMTEQEWQRHINAHSHKRVMAGVRKRADREAREREMTTNSIT